MGYAIAEEMACHGAHVTLVSGPTSLPTPAHPLIRTIRIKSAKEMHAECLRYFPTSQVAILSAAVADYTPKVVAERKIKKKDVEFCLELVKTVDIAASLGCQKRAHQLLVGFALETDNELSNALIKLGSKNLDMIVLNSLNDEGAAFGHDTNKITIIHRNQEMQAFGLKSKQEVAGDIVAAIANRLALSTNGTLVSR
jgi:phosphopantothenoylcysteine decarboxylase / phosphopantothenate---cysteine ligase